MRNRVRCKVCGYEFTTPPDFCPKCLTKVERSPEAFMRPEEVEVVKLPVEDMPPEEGGFIAGLIEGEGSFSISLVRTNTIKDIALPPAERVYHRNYLLPFFTFEMRKKPPVERVSKALAVSFHYGKIRRRWIINISRIPHVLAITKWSLLYLTPEYEKAVNARMVLNAFKKGRGIKITPEEVKEMWGLTTEERYEWLKKKKKI